MMTTLRARSLVLTIAAIAAACGGGRTLQNGSSATLLEVENLSTLDMTIYAVTGTGARDRLGTVTALSNETFEIPRSLVVSSLDLRIAADPVGSARTAFSDRLTLIPGETVTIRIPPSVGHF
jgi:hypothetical protein